MGVLIFTQDTSLSRCGGYTRNAQDNETRGPITLWSSPSMSGTLAGPTLK